MVWIYAEALYGLGIRDNELFYLFFVKSFRIGLLFFV